MRRILQVLMVAAVLFGLFATPVMADWETRTGDTVVVNKGEVTSGDLWCSGQRVVIDGVVDGDLLVMAQEVVVRGEVKGDILGMAGRLRIDGPIGGDVRVYGGEFRLSSTIQGNVFAYCLYEIVLGKNSSVQGFWGTSGIFDGNGTIQDRLQVTSEILKFGGKVQGEATLQAGRELLLKPGTSIKTLYYAAPKPLKKPNGVSLGTVDRVAQAKKKQTSAAVVLGWIWFLGTMLMGFFMIAMVPQRTILWSSSIYGIRTFVRGFSLMFVTPFAVFFLALTGLGLPLALFIGLFYLVFLLYSQLPFYLFLGRRFIRLFRIERSFSPFFLLIVGGLLMAFVSTVPYIGVWVNIAATAFGIGILTQRQPQAINIINTQVPPEPPVEK